MRQENGTRILMGVIVAVTDSSPGDPEGLYYTVEVDDGGDVSLFEGVQPSYGYRPDMDSLTALNLQPFKVNQIVPIAVQVRGAEDVYSILVGEQISVAECGGGEP